MWGAKDLVVLRGRHRAVDGVSIGVGRQEVTAVVGGDGAGKTSLLRALTGLDRAASGSVTVPRRAKLGVVVAGGGLPDDLTVAEVLAFADAVYGNAAPGAIERALERTGLTAAADRLVGQLSGGMRRKLALAAAVLHQPELLLLDEPSAGVDPVSRVELWGLLGEEVARGAGVITATTEADEAQRAHHTIALDGGKAVPLAEFVAAVARGAPPPGGSGAGGAPQSGNDGAEGAAPWPAEPEEEGPDTERGLTSEEESAAASVFGSTLATGDITLTEGGPLAVGGYARTLPDYITFPAGTLTDPPSGYMKWLIHELGHCWQYQQGASIPGLLWDALGADYDYGGEQGLRDALAEGKAFADFGYEEQASILADYYSRIGGNTSAYDPYINSVRDGTWESAPAQP